MVKYHYFMRSMNRTFVQMDLEGSLVEDSTIFLLQNRRLFVLEEILGYCFRRIPGLCTGTVACLGVLECYNTYGILSLIICSLPSASRALAGYALILLTCCRCIIYFLCFSIGSSAESIDRKTYAVSSLDLYGHTTSKVLSAYN